MPELPEVETVRRQLHKRLVASEIVAVDIWRTGRLQPEAETLTMRLIGRTIEAVERRAKLLIFRFDNTDALTAHLKMTGRFTFVNPGYQREKHDRVHFVLRGSDGRPFSMVWSDIRQFGFLKYVSVDELREICDAYGPEPLDATVMSLVDRLSLPSGRTIKAVLLDQAVIAGIGNIYADEACFRAGIRPTRRASRLHADELERLASSIQDVLRASLKLRGTSAHNYLDTEGKRGGFLSLLQAYGRTGEPCKTCQTPIKKIVVSQRGTHYCPQCQK